jgi:hypothetical protein
MSKPSLRIAHGIGTPTEIELRNLSFRVSSGPVGEKFGSEFSTGVGHEIEEEFALRGTQLMTYLKITKLRLGFLINFGLHKAYPQRIIFDEKRRPNFEGWDDGFFQHTSMGNPFDSTIASLRNIDQALGPAYHSKIYQAALSTELKHNRIILDNKVCIPLEVGNRQFKPFEIDYWLVEQAFLLGVLAGKDRPRAWDLLRMRSYLHRLNLRHGLIAYWSTNNFQLYGIYQR